MAHVAMTDEGNDPQLISGMFVAIRNFVQESFIGDESEEGLNRMRVGDVEVIVENSTDAVLACCVRGAPPESLRSQMQKTLEAIHRDQWYAIESFAGDMASMSESKAHLQQLLIDRRQELNRRNQFVGFALLTLILAGFAALGFWKFQKDQAWNAAVHDVEQIPGIEVVEHASGWRSHRIHLLWDPSADHPAWPLAAAGYQEGRNLTLRVSPFPQRGARNRGSAQADRRRDAAHEFQSRTTRAARGPRPGTATGNQSDSQLAHRTATARRARRPAGSARIGRSSETRTRRREGRRQRHGAARLGPGSC